MSTAVSGNALAVTPEPIVEMACPSHSFRNVILRACVQLAYRPIRSQNDIEPARSEY